MSNLRILCIDPEAPLRKLIKSELKKCDYEVIAVADYVAGRIELATTASFSAVLVNFYIDNSNPDFESGAMRFITDIQHSHPHTRIIVIGGPTQIPGIHASFRKPYFRSPDLAQQTHFSLSNFFLVVS